MDARSLIEQMLTTAGVHIDGDAPADILIKDKRFYDAVLNEGSMALGESYMEGWWDCKMLDDFFYRILHADLEKKIRHNLNLMLLSLSAKLFNRQSIQKSADVAKKHYNLGNDLFEQMLDKYMMYSCAYWDGAEDLDAAQANKLNLVCRKLKLGPGLKVLDIGCGWGGFAQYAAQHYGVEVTGVTISTSQAELAVQRCAGLPVDIKVMDYRNLNSKFDRIVSIGMFEHVGPKNYRVFMETVWRNLNENGLFLLHTIGGNEQRSFTDPWIDKYIFPNGVIPSPEQICAVFEKDFVLQDWHNFGHDYDRTLLEWLKNFRAAWPLLKDAYDERFFRMWEYYLSICAASFRCEKNHLWQIVLSRKDDNLIYQSVR